MDRYAKVTGSTPVSGKLLCFLGLLRAQIVLTIEGEVFSFLTMGWGSEREGCCRDMDYLESAPGRER